MTVEISNPRVEHQWCNKFFMVGKVLSRKIVKPRIVISLLKSLWRPKVDMQIMAISGGRFLCVFDMEEALHCVLRGSPWYFGHALEVLAEVHKDAIPIDVMLCEQEFWIRVHGLPLSLMTRAIGNEIGKVLGRLVAVESRDGLCLREFMCIRVGVDATKPLHRGLLFLLPP
ncbi:hypothetical protein EV2_020172 [Malus domestica]